MRPALLFPCLCLCAALSSGAQAQQPSSQRRPDRTYTVVPERELFRVFPGNRGKIGITVNILPGPLDSIGALVDAVTPAGPAYRAGIRSGDIIVTLNSRSLIQAARESRKLSPALALIELTTQMDAGDTARLEYQRGGERRRATVVLEPMRAMFDEPATGQMFSYRTPMEGPDRSDLYFNFDDQPVFDPNTPGGNVMILRTRVMDLELAPMNPALGQYFGIGEGVLVINVPPSSKLNLRPGDVVLAVDGRRMSDPGQMFRVLQSYEPGEDLRIDVMRMKRRESIVGKVVPNR
ncbi:MAG: PDZ domain-containing protein [Gemmatimonadota bacterium]